MASLRHPVANSDLQSKIIHLLNINCDTYNGSKLMRLKDLVIMLKMCFLLM